MSDRMIAWRSHAFGPASELPYRRRTSDWVRLVIAVMLLAVFIVHEGDIGDAEQGLFELFNGLPDGLLSFFDFLYRFGALWAVGLVVIAALVARRWRLARDLAVGGGLAWVLARVIGAIVVGDGSVSSGVDAVIRFRDDTPDFPVVRLAIIVAVIAVASPYLTRPTRRIGQLLILLMGMAALYLGTGLPNGVFAAVVLGWGIAAAVHLAFGSPGGRPTTAQIASALDELGVSVESVALVDPQPGHGTVMAASQAHGGSLVVRVLGRDEADAQLIAKVWRFLVYKDGGPRVRLTRIEDVQVQAYVCLLAERVDVRVPKVLVAGTAGPSAALLVQRPLDGTPLADADPSTVTDALLDDVWSQVARLHSVRVAHGRLNAHHIVLTPDGPAIADFESASGTGSAQQRAGDVAELLVSTAGIVGDDRAIAAALRGIGESDVRDALPMLQLAALSSEVRVGAPHERKDLATHVSALRDAAAKATGTDSPPLQQLYRVSATNLMMAVGTLIALSVLMSQVGSPEELWDTVKHADLGWLIAAIIVSFATNMATAIALMGTVAIPLPLWRTTELQLSMSFSNLAVPAVGGMAAQIRFLQRQGVDLASAVASGGLLINVGNILAQLILLLFAIALSPDTFKVQDIPVSSIVSVVLIALLAIAVIAGLIMGIPKLRHMALPPLKSATATMSAAVRSPRRVAFLVGGNAINALMYGFVMYACVAAFGGSINYWTLLALNIFIGTIASLIPIPGGNTAVSTVGMSGAMTAFGVPTEIAVAAVLTNQLVANYLPAIPGWFATNDMLHHDYL